MNVKIQGGGKNYGVYANDGSAAGLIAYLQHEDQERLKNGKEIIPFFTGQGIDVTPEEAIMKLDRNHKKLHARDAKFYHLDINPSQDELRAMGDTEDEIIAGCKRYAIAMTQAYAENFHKDVVISTDEAGNPVTRPLSGEDIMIFWKIHTTRDDKEGLQVHLQSGVSRKDIHNKIQLSPVTNHKGTTSGAVKGGFERTAYYRTAEEVFDKMFGYKRQQEETFDFYLAQKEERKAEEKRQSMLNEYEDEHGDVDVYDAQMAAAVAKRNKRRRDEFWNEYHSKYQPMFEQLTQAFDNSLELVRYASERYDVCRAIINEKYNDLRDLNGQIHVLQNDIQKAATAKDIVKAFSALALLINPVAAIVIGLIGSTIIEADRSAAIAARKNLRTQAAAIIDSIEELKFEQAALRQDKADKLKVYIENKEAKIALQTKINNLKAILEKPLEATPSVAESSSPATRKTAAPPVQVVTPAVPAATHEEISQPQSSRTSSDAIDNQNNRWEDYRSTLKKYFKNFTFDFAACPEQGKESFYLTINYPDKHQKKILVTNNIIRLKGGDYIDLENKEYIRATAVKKANTPSFSPAELQEIAKYGDISRFLNGANNYTITRIQMTPWKDHSILSIEINGVFRMLQNDNGRIYLAAEPGITDDYKKAIFDFAWIDENGKRYKRDIETELRKILAKKQVHPEVKAKQNGKGGISM